MFTNPYLSGELARQRQRDMLAGAERRRLVRRLHDGTSGTAPSRQRLRGVLRAAARLRPAPGT